MGTSGADASGLWKTLEAMTAGDAAQSLSNLIHKELMVRL